MKSFYDSIWVVGDVHGCSREFRIICREIMHKDPEALIIQLGDLIDRGPDLVEVFEVVWDYGVWLIIGNHEMNFLQEVIGDKQCRSKERTATIEKFNTYKNKTKERIIKTIQSSYNHIIIPDDTNQNAGYVLSHSAFIRGKNSNGWTNSSTSAPGGNGDHKNLVSIHGHMAWAYDDVLNHLDDKFINIDSGLCYGGYLTALKLSTKEVIKVNAFEVYHQK